MSSECAADGVNWVRGQSIDRTCGTCKFLSYHRRRTQDSPACRRRPAVYGHTLNRTIAPRPLTIAPLGSRAAEYPTDSPNLAATPLIIDQRPVFSPCVAVAYTAAACSTLPSTTFAHAGATALTAHGVTPDLRPHARDRRLQLVPRHALQPQRFIQCIRLLACLNRSPLHDHQALPQGSSFYMKDAGTVPDRLERIRHERGLGGPRPCGVEAHAPRVA